MKRAHLSPLLCAGILVFGAALGCDDFWNTPIATISVSPPSPSLLTGTQLQFTAMAQYEDGSKKVLSGPTWTTSNAAIVYINESGVGTAVATGSATITATSEGVSGSTTVSVVSSPLTSIEISPYNPSAAVSQGTQQFAATGFFSDGSTRDITTGVTWSSSNTGVATISQTGLATLANAGSTTIKATSGNISGTSTLTVTP